MRSSFSEAVTLRRQFPPHWPRLGILCLAFLAVPASAAEVWVVTDHAHPISGEATRRILLDTPARLKAELASALPPDPDQAAALVRRRLEQGGADLQRQLAAAYQGVADAWSLGITKIPAIVVDRRYVVYGETDVARAVGRIEQYRGAQP